MMGSSVRSNGPERRAAPRIDERIPLAISDAGAELATETKNLSAAGVYCTVDRFIAPMSKLQLRFELPERSRRVCVRCVGVVVRVEPVVDAERGRYHIGVFFTDIAERDRAAITRFVRQRLSTGSSTA